MKIKITTFGLAALAAMASNCFFPERMYGDTFLSLMLALEGLFFLADIGKKERIIRRGKDDND